MPRLYVELRELLPRFDREVRAELGARRARHQYESCGSRLRGQHAVEDASGVSAVLGPVGSVDFALGVVAGVDECNVLLNTTGPYPTLVPLLRTPEPMTAAASDGSNVQVIAVTDDPYGDRFLRSAVAPEWCNLHLFCCSDLGELVTFPSGHRASRSKDTGGGLLRAMSPAVPAVAYGPPSTHRAI